MSEFRVERVEPPMDEEMTEHWSADVEGYTAESYQVGHLEDWSWRVTLELAEYIRAEPQQSEFHGQITDALRRAPGVTDVVHEDREVWALRGTPTGPGLLEAIAPIAAQFARYGG